MSSSNMTRYFTSDLWAMMRRRSTHSRLTPTIRSEIKGFLSINFAWSISQSKYIHQIPTPQPTTHTTRKKTANLLVLILNPSRAHSEKKKLSDTMQASPLQSGADPRIVYWAHFPSRAWEKPEMGYGQMAHAAMPHKK